MSGKQSTKRSAPHKKPATDKKKPRSPQPVQDNLTPHSLLSIPFTFCSANNSKIDLVISSNPPYGQAADKLLNQSLEESLVCISYLLVKVHHLESLAGEGEPALALAQELVKKGNTRKIKFASPSSKKVKGEASKRRQTEKFIEVFVSSGINDEYFDLLEDLMEIAVWASMAEKRPIRHLGVHAAMLLLTTFTTLCKTKLCFLDEISQHSQRVARERSEEAERQIEYLKKSIEKIKKQVLFSRSVDVMLEVRVEIADAFAKMAGGENLHLIIDKPTAKIIGQLLYDKNKSVKKRALGIAAQILDTVYRPGEMTESQKKLKEFVYEMYDERHVTRIIQMAYKDVGTVAVKAIQTLAGMYKHAMLDDSSVDYTCRLVLRKLPQVAREAARFIVQSVGDGKILGLVYELRENATVFSYNETAARASAEKLASILGYATVSLDPKARHKAISDALRVLEKDTVTVFDVKSLAELLTRGEKEQQSESRLKSVQLDAACHMILWAADRINELREVEESIETDWVRFRKTLVSQIDYLLLSNLPRLLSILKHVERVEYIIKATRAVNVEAVRENGINLKQLQKIVKKICGILKVTSSERVAKAANKMLIRLATETGLDSEFKTKLGQMQEEIIRQVQDFLKDPEAMKNKAPALMKFPIISASCSPSQIALIQNVVLPLLSDQNLQVTTRRSKEGQETATENYTDENLLYIFQGLFALYANAFTSLCKGRALGSFDLEKFEQLRQDTLAVYVACMRIHESNIKISAKCWASLSNLISISSNDGIRTRFNDLYYEPDHIILAAMTEYLSYFIKAGFENDEEVSKMITDGTTGDYELMLEINRAAQLLILSCETVFHTELSVLYLAIFGSNQKNALLWDTMRGFIKKLANRCVVFNGKSMYYLYIKEAILTCFNYEFQYPELHSEELLRKAKAEGRSMDHKKYYSLVRSKDLMKLVLNECNFTVFAQMEDEEFEVDVEEVERVQKEIEIYNGFVTDLLKEGLRAASNFPLLEVVQMGVTTEAFSRERLGWMIQLFDALSQHVLKIDETIKEEDKALLKEFKNGLLQKAAAKKIKRTPYGKAVTKHEALRKSSITPAKAEERKLNEIEENAGDEDSAKKKEDSGSERGGKKRERSPTVKKKSTRKRIDFDEEEGKQSFYQRKQLILMLVKSSKCYECIEQCAFLITNLITVNAQQHQAKCRLLYVGQKYPSYLLCVPAQMEGTLLASPSSFSPASSSLPLFSNIPLKSF
eukprot:TRINITY_DN1106_c0_g1_i1.p1 TRINITY_DN1106_c0_g1~~TRINITY_DN1106_c0_g1_i1.p1  ORF type:complete len:1238 (-),score=155.63 TRINITY_DN1106_c0_g1_i1:1853-5566(-)